MIVGASRKEKAQILHCIMYSHEKWDRSHFLEIGHIFAWSKVGRSIGRNIEVRLCFYNIARILIRFPARSSTFWGNEDADQVLQGWGPNLEASDLMSRRICHRYPFLECRYPSEEIVVSSESWNTKWRLNGTRETVYLVYRVLLMLNTHRDSKFIPGVHVVDPRPDSSRKYLNVCKIGSEHWLPRERVGRKSRGNLFCMHFSRFLNGARYVAGIINRSLQLVTQNIFILLKSH